jgi:oxepin-CoA hydrolase/3-oxo-5,6-dehydrosuberyl-CoA semialdehyde dehydrogenase
MAPLSSYVSGAWHVPPDEGAPLHDAVTGVEITRISSTGVPAEGPGVPAA